MPSVGVAVTGEALIARPVARDHCSMIVIMRSRRTFGVGGAGRNSVEACAFVLRNPFSIKISSRDTNGARMK